MMLRIPFWFFVEVSGQSVGPNTNGEAVRSLGKKLPTYAAYYYYYWYSALLPVWAETRAQSGDWYSSGTLHPRQVLRGSLPLLSPAVRRSHFRNQVPSVTTREILAAEGGTVGENVVR